MCPKCIICGDEYDAAVYTTHVRRGVCSKGDCFAEIEAVIDLAYPNDIWWALHDASRVHNLPWKKLKEIAIKQSMSEEERQLLRNLINDLVNPPPGGEFSLDDALEELYNVPVRTQIKELLGRLGI